MISEDLQKRVRTLRSLPTLPTVVQKLTQMVDVPKANISEVADLIAHDQVLSAKVLRMVNSPFYGFPGRIASITHALVLLGFNAVKGIVLGTSVFEIMEQTMVGLWTHSVGCAAAARLLAKQNRLKDPENYAVAGLLHDLGKVIIALNHPEGYRDIRQAAAARRKPLFAVEAEALGVTHAEVGGWLAQQWNLPRILSEPMMFHHEPGRAKSAPLHTAVVHVADLLIKARGFGDSGDPFVPPRDAAAWERLMPPTENLPDLLDELDLALASAEDFLP